MGKHTCFTVNGKPFFSIGGQLHNSSGYALGKVSGSKAVEDAQKSFQTLKAIGANTVAVPVCWDAFEPIEGEFCTEYVKNIIDQVRVHDLHAILLWFGTWKNGQSEYAPVWIKKDRNRFPRVKCVDGSETAALSPFYEQTKEMDKRAFVQLMKFIREYDEQTQTVIAVQVENEPGIFAPTIRDFSELGTAAFHGQAATLAIQTARKDSGSLYEAWEKAESKEMGSWAEVFGTFGAELCTAYAIASYVNEVAEAGKAEYDLFLYTNVWMDREAKRGWSMAGLDYPSGGAVSKVLSLWRAATPALDAISPDIYETEPECIESVQQTYGNEHTFYVPESGITNVNASMMFQAVGTYGAIGYHVFGIERMLEEDGTISPFAEGIVRSFSMLTTAKDLLEQRLQVNALVQHPGQDSQRLVFGDWLCRVSFAGASPEYAGWVAMDWRHEKELNGINQVPMSIEDETARGLLFQVCENEYYLVGHKVRLFWQKMNWMDGAVPATMLNGQHQAYNMGLLLIEEGHFENGHFVTDRIRSGDEARHGIWAQADCGVVHFILD